MKKFLPNIFKPRGNFKLLRVGNIHDGGYLVEENSLKNSLLLISAGIKDDWSFEKNFKKIAKCKIICFDATSNNKFFIQKIIIEFLNIFLNDKKYYIPIFKRILNVISSIGLYLNFKFFFFKNILVKKLITGYGQLHRHYLTTSLSEILKKINKKKNSIFLKLDIEGCEYDCLPDILKYQKFLSGFVIEFHEIDRNLDKIINFVNKCSHILVHVHANNDYVQDENNNPCTIEMSFSYKPQLLNKKKYKTPHKLDRKNRYSHDEVYLHFRGAKKNKKYSKIVSI